MPASTVFGGSRVQPDSEEYLAALLLGRTLAELGIVWNLALLGALQSKPLVVVGRGWERVLRTMVAELHTIETDLQFLRFVPDVPAAVDMLGSIVT